MSVSAGMVKELRDKTGAGMMDCKQALLECEDLEKAVDWLRQKGLAKAAKRSGRATSEGYIGLETSVDGKTAAMFEFLCETDFVAKSERFQEMAKDIAAQLVLGEPASGDILDMTCAKAGLKVQDLINEAVSSIGENITAGRYARYEVPQGFVGCYLHNTGKIGVLVELVCQSDKVAQSEAFRELAKNLAMQIAASNPVAVSTDALDPVLVEREREVYREKAREEGKKEEVIEKIVEGGIKKFYKDVVLLEQLYIRDDKKTVQDLVREAKVSLGEDLSVGRFTRLQVGVE